MGDHNSPPELSLLILKGVVVRQIDVYSLMLWHVDMLKCKLDSTNRGTFSNSAEKILSFYVLYIQGDFSPLKS